MEKKTTIEYEIIEKKATLSVSNNKWTKEYNIIKWNGKTLNDLRAWSPDHKHMAKGITLTDQELNILNECLDKEVIAKILEKYNSNHLSLKKIVNEINTNGSTEFGLSDSDKSYEQGANDAFEFVLRCFGYDF